MHDKQTFAVTNQTWTLTTTTLLETRPGKGPPLPGKSRILLPHDTGKSLSQTQTTELLLPQPAVIVIQDRISPHGVLVPNTDGAPVLPQPAVTTRALQPNPPCGPAPASGTGSTLCAPFPASPLKPSVQTGMQSVLVLTPLCVCRCALLLSASGPGHWNTCPAPP